jgi:hypothetical protein
VSCSSMERVGRERPVAGDAQFAREAGVLDVALFPVPVPGLRRATAGGALRPTIYILCTVTEVANATIC